MILVNDTLVTVVIPSYNRFESLSKAIESVQSQSLQDFKIVVINDASKDKRYKTTDFGKNIKIINLDENSVEKKGYFSDSIRNVGIENSNSKYVAFLDDDDYWLPSKLEKQIKLLESSSFKMACTEAIAGYGHYNSKNDNLLYLQELNFKEISKNYKKSKLKKKFKKNFLFNFDYPDVWDLDFLQVHNCIITSSVVVERNLLNKIGNFRDVKNKRLYSDYDCWLGLLSHTDCYYFREPLLYYDLNVGMNLNRI